MISLFDQDNNGTISCSEFAQLYKYITDWRRVFMQHDRDNSGSIDFQEFSATLAHFGYQLNPQFVQWLMMRFDRQRLNKLGFDKFVYIFVCLQVCFICDFTSSSKIYRLFVLLYHVQILTKSFRALDVCGRGVVTMSFEQFLGAAFNMCV